MELRGYAQTDVWGKVGKKSIVGLLHWNPKKIRKLEEFSDVHFSELWIGTHPKGETILRKTRERLSTYLKRHSEILGTSKYEFGVDIPFVMKIMSIEKPLALHIHPNQRQAKILNKQNSNLYPDKIHKPEMVVALTYLEVMAGVRPVHQIVYYLKNVPELENLITGPIIEKYLQNRKEFYLKSVIERFLTASNEKIAEVIENYFKRMEIEDRDTRDNQHYDLILKLQGLHPYDHGVLSPFFFNHFKLKPDEAVYIPPSVPHTFIYGDAVVCTTRATNLVRGGLTSDYRDIETFIEYADLASYQVEKLMIKPSYGPHQIIYDCDEDEFILSKVKIEKNSYHTIYDKDSFRIFIIIKGTALNHDLTKLRTGTIMFIPQMTTYHLQALEDLVLFIVETNLVI